MDAARIESILAEAGWIVHRTDEPGAFAGAFGSPEATFAVRVRLGPERLEVVVGPYLAAPPAGRAAALHERLLGVNAKTTMARFVLDAAGTVFLRIDWPRANLDDSEVRDALDAAAYYAEEHYAELSALA